MLESLDITRTTTPPTLRRDVSTKESNSMTLLVKGSHDLFNSSYASKYTLEVEDMITIHILSNALKTEVESLISSDKAFMKVVDPESNSKMRLMPSNDLLRICPINNLRGVFGCITRLNIQERVMDSISNSVTRLSPRTNEDKYELYEKTGMWTQGVIGESLFSRDLGYAHNEEIVERFDLNDRYRKGFVLSPTIPWRQTDMNNAGITSMLEMSQHSITVALVSLDQNENTDTQYGAILKIPLELPVSEIELRQNIRIQRAIEAAIADGIGADNTDVNLDIGSIEGSEDVIIENIMEVSLGLPLTVEEFDNSTQLSVREAFASTVMADVEDVEIVGVTLVSGIRRLLSGISIDMQVNLREQQDVVFTLPSMQKRLNRVIKIDISITKEPTIKRKVAALQAPNCGTGFISYMTRYQLAKANEIKAAYNDAVYLLPGYADDTTTYVCGNINYETMIGGHIGDLSFINTKYDKYVPSLHSRLCAEAFGWGFYNNTALENPLYMQYTTGNPWEHVACYSKPTTENKVFFHSAHFLSCKMMKGRLLSNPEKYCDAEFAEHCCECHGRDYINSVFVKEAVWFGSDWNCEIETVPEDPGVPVDPGQTPIPVDPGQTPGQSQYPPVYSGVWEKISNTNAIYTVSNEAHGNGNYDVTTSSSDDCYHAYKIFNGETSECSGTVDDYGGIFGEEADGTLYPYGDANGYYIGAQTLTGTDYLGSWIVVKFPVNIAIRSLVFIPRDNINIKLPDHFKLFGRNSDTENWQEVYGKSETSEETSFSFENDVYYTQYGLIVNKLRGRGYTFNIKQWKIYGEEATCSENAVRGEQPGSCVCKPGFATPSMPPRAKVYCNKFDGFVHGWDHPNIWDSNTQLSQSRS